MSRGEEREVGEEFRLRAEDGRDVLAEISTIVSTGEQNSIFS